MRNTPILPILLLVTAATVGCGGDSGTYVVTLSTAEETPLVLPMISTHPPDGTPKYTVTGQPQHGTIDGTFPNAIYTPATDYNGDDEIVVRVEDGSGAVDQKLEITVTPVNDAPKATPDLLAATEDTVQMIASATLLQNDKDADGDTLTIVGVPNVRFGTATLEGDAIKFTPKVNFNGSETLLYTVSDGHASATGVVTISVGGVNDAPVAVDDYLYTDEDTQLVIDSATLPGNDSDPDGQALTVTAVSNVQNGTASVANGTVTFTPAANFNGDATFNYTLSDGALTSTALCTVTVGPVNDAPVAVADQATAAKNTAKVIPFATLLANDTDVDGDPLTVTAVTNGAHGTVTINLNAQTVTFTPAANYISTATSKASFTYTVSDGTLTATGTVTLTVI